MPGFLFNFIDGERQSGPITVDLENLDAARREALRTACLSINEKPEKFWETGEWQMIVTDDRGLVLFTLHMTATVAPAARGCVRTRQSS